MYSINDKMADLMAEQPNVLPVISRFRLPIGVEDKTIAEVCKAYNVDTDTFLAVINFKTGTPNNVDLSHISLHSLLDYLRNSHSQFFDIQMPQLRRLILEGINQPNVEPKIPLLIIQLYDEYVAELEKHMTEENEQVFPYIKDLLNGIKPTNYSIEQFARQHRVVDEKDITDKLTEIKNLIIRFFPTTTDNNMLLLALREIYYTEQDLFSHCSIEDKILTPAVKKLERKLQVEGGKTVEKQAQEELSDREKDVLLALVNGLSNKEIADKLCISVHTVITHRKHISQKLNIHSTAGLTIYAIVNKLIDINELKTL